jgi:hypothetical protein
MRVTQDNFMAGSSEIMTTDIEALVADLQAALYGPASWDDTTLMSRSIDALHSQADRIQALEAKCAELERLERRWKYMEDRFIGADFEWGHAEDGQGGVPVLLIQIDEDLKVWGDLALTVDAAIAAQAGSKGV